MIKQLEILVFEILKKLKVDGQNNLNPFFLTSHIHLQQNITKCLFTKVKKKKIIKLDYQSKSCWIDRDFRRNET